MTLDKWTDSEVDSMIEVGGNSQANAIYEAFLPEGYLKPHSDSTQEEREKFIRFVLILEGYSFSMGRRYFIKLFEDCYLLVCFANFICRRHFDSSVWSITPYSLS